MFKNILVIISFLLFSSATVLANEQLSAPQVAGGVSFQAPKGWNQIPPSSRMRLFQFEVPGAGESESAVMTVFYFGPGQGGAIDANIERWKRQFTSGPEDAAPKIVKSKVGNLPVTTVSLEGTYSGGMGMGGKKTEYAALAVIAEGKKGPVFFKMTGPKAVIGKAQNEFDLFVETLRLHLVE